MVILYPPIEVRQDTSLTVGGFTGCPGFHSVDSIQFLISIIVVSEELGVLSLPYPYMDYVESIAIITYGYYCFVTALLSPGRISIEPDPLHLGRFRQGSILCEPVVLEDVPFDYRLT